MNYKLLTIITLAVLSVSAVYLMADADGSDADTGTYTDGKWTFNVVDGNATIVSYTGYVMGTLNIPSTVSDGTNTYPVTVIGAGSAITNSDRFASPTGNSLTIPDGVTTIGNNAFSNCSKFDGTLDLPDSLVSIGASAFYVCSGFTGDLTIPDSVTTIGGSAFISCTGFTGDLTIPDSVTTIGDNAFQGCAGFTGTLTLSESTVDYGAGVFQACTGFTGTLTIPECVQSIGNYCFNGLTNVSELVVKGTPETIGTNAFNMSALETVYNLGDNDTIIAGAYGIPETATVLRSMNTFTYSIVDNHAVITGTTGDTWTDINIPSVITDGGVDYPVRAIRGTGPIISDAQIPTTATLTIPDSVTIIGDSAFYNCSHITGSLTIPDGVVSIGSYAFSGCTGLTGSLTIPDGVTTIDENAFTNCSGLTSVILPDGLTSIGDSAFGYCSGLTSVILPDGLTSLDTACFQYTGLTGTLTIPDSVTTIGASAFRGCTGLTGLDLGVGVVTIRNQAFTNCTSLTGTLIIPASVDVIEDNAFTQTAFNSLIFLGSPSSVGSAVFGSSIKEVLNLGTNEVTTTSYGLNADEVRNDIPGSSYIAPTTVTKTETNDGPAYDIIIMLPLIMILGVVLIAIWGLRDKF